MSQNTLSNKELASLDAVFDVFGETGDDEATSPDGTHTPAGTTTVSGTVDAASTTPPVTSSAPGAPTDLSSPNTAVDASTPLTTKDAAVSPTTTNVATSTPATAASGTGADDAGDPEQRSPRREPNGYRWLAAGVAAGVAAFVMLQGPSPLGSAQTQALSDPAGAVSATLADAKRWYAEHGTFTGFTGADGTDVAAGGPVMIVTAGSGSSCTYAGIAPQHDTVIASDATGAHCAPERLAALRVDLANL